MGVGELTSERDSGLGSMGVWEYGSMGVSELTSERDSGVRE